VQRRSFSVTCPGLHHLLLTSSVILLLYRYRSVCSLCLPARSRIPPSVVNQLCDPPPLLLALCLQSLSARIVLKLSRELLELFLQPGLCLIFLLCPHQCSKLVHLIHQRSHISPDDQGKKCFKLPPFSPFCSCSASYSSPLQLIWTWIFPSALFQALLGLWKAQLAAPTGQQLSCCHGYLSAEVLPAAQHPNQLRNMFHKSVFSQKKAKEDAKKDAVCPEMLLQAAATRAAPFWK